MRPKLWCPQEPDEWPIAPSEAIKGWREVPENRDLRRAITDEPDEDAPRKEYADWMSAQKGKLCREIGAFVRAQLLVADAFRRLRYADVRALRTWSSSRRTPPEQHVSPGMFRAGGSLRPWLVSSLTTIPGVAWPQAFRGFVERVWMRTQTFARNASLLFETAPIRSLVLVGVPEFVDQLAACSSLRRIRSLSLPRYALSDSLNDGHLARLVASPHLRNLSHLRLVHQRKLTPAAYATVVRMLPHLSSFEVFLPQPEWECRTSFDTQSRCERIVIGDSVISAESSLEWISPLEQELGPIRCLHPDVHYGPEPDLESFIVNPIALDAGIAVRRAHVEQRLPSEIIA